MLRRLRSERRNPSIKTSPPDLDAYAKFLMEKVLALPVVVNVQSSFVLETVNDSTVLPV